MLNRQPLGFRIHTRKLNRQPLGFRKLNRHPPVLKADKHLVTRNQRDMHPGRKFERHSPGLSSHVKFSKLNQSLRPGFRPSELQTMIESDNIKECRAIWYHRPLAKTSRCSRPLQLSRQRKESSTKSSILTSVMKKRRKQLSSTANSAGAHQCHLRHQCPHHQVRPPSNSYTSPGDNQEDAFDSETVADKDHNDRKQAQRDPAMSIDDQRESPSDTHAPLIVGKHADASGPSRTMTCFDDTVRRECHLINYESANQDSRQRPLPDSRQIVSDQQDTLTGEDEYLRRLYPCRQPIWSQYSCDPLSVLSTSDIAYSSTAYRRGTQLQRLHVGDTEAASVNSASMLSPSATTRSSHAMRFRSETTIPPQDVVTTAGCSEIIVAKDIALLSTPKADVQRTLYCDDSQQAGYAEDIPIKPCMTIIERNSHRTSNKSDDMMNNESHNEFSNVNVTVDIDTDRTRSVFFTARTLSPQAIDRKTFVEEEGNVQVQPPHLRLRWSMQNAARINAKKFGTSTSIDITNIRTTGKQRHCQASDRKNKSSVDGTTL